MKAYPKAGASDMCSLLSQKDLARPRHSACASHRGGSIMGAQQKRQTLECVLSGEVAPVGCGAFV